MTAPTPPNLGALKVITDPGERARAATAYITAREEAIVAARRVRDDAVLELVKTVGPAKAQRAAELSETTVRAIRRAAGQLPGSTR